MPSFQRQRTGSADIQIVCPSCGKTNVEKVRETCEGATVSATYRCVNDDTLFVMVVELKDYSYMVTYIWDKLVE